MTNFFWIIHIGCDLTVILARPEGTREMDKHSGCGAGFEFLSLEELA